MERWTAHVGLGPDYQVSDLGNIRRITKGQGVKRTGQPLTCWPQDSGHLVVTIRAKRYRVHVLVLEAFIGPRPDGHIGCHRNGNPADNAASNLYWGTWYSNQMDRITHGTSQANWTHCVHGHEFSETNTRWRINSRNGHKRRDCIACSRERARKQRHG